MVAFYLQNLTLSSILKFDVCNCSHWEGVECYSITDLPIVRRDYRYTLFSSKGKKIFNWNQLRNQNPCEFRVRMFSMKCCFILAMRDPQHSSARLRVLFDRESTICSCSQDSTYYTISGYPSWYNPQWFSNNYHPQPCGIHLTLFVCLFYLGWTICLLIKFFYMKLPSLTLSF